MEDEKPKIISCPQCKSIGSEFGCAKCKRMQMGISRRGRWLYWGYPLTRYNLQLVSGRRVLNKIRALTALAFILNCWIWLVFLIYKRGGFTYLLEMNWFLFSQQMTSNMRLLFWLGALGLLYLFYRVIRQGEAVGAVEHYVYDYDSAKNPQKEMEVASWEQARRLPRRKKINISRAFTREALIAVEQAYKFADKNKKSEVAAEDLFVAVLSSNRIENIFIRLGLSAKSIQEKVKESMSGGNSPQNPALAEDFQRAIFQAYEEAYLAHQDYVGISELLVAVVKESPQIQELLFDLEIDKIKLANVIEWARIRERLRRQYAKLRKAASHHSKRGMDKAMTALATPYLNEFSEDMTLLAHYGHLDPCVARGKETEEIYRIIEGGQHSVLLVGEHGVGRRSVIDGIAQSMIADDVPSRLRDKRLVRLSISALLGGTSPAGAVERLRDIAREATQAGNIVLFIHNLHELAGVSAGGEGSLDVADALAEILRNGKFLTLATTTPEDFARHISSTALANVFEKIDIPEMDQDQAIQVLESKIGFIEYKQNVFFSYDAVEKAAQFAGKFMHETRLPGSALELATEAANLSKNKKGGNSLVTGDEVAAVVTEKTKIPLTAITSDESSKLLKLEEEMHKRVIGQDEGVSSVANALRRARAEVRSVKRPIANFLFLGPTGVGKTELAKTIAAVYFGGENRMIRIDMSEYQDKSGVYRLIGMPGEKGTGVLTEATRHDPFSLLLLDEVEKADPDILNLFLQVMDDGRLTDSTGRVVDFTNIILIATSNAATGYIQELLNGGLSVEAIKERLIHGELKQYFKPEFLNRFDGIIIFKPLSQEDIKQVASLMLGRVAKNLEAKGIKMRVEDSALDYLARAGFDPEFGARPMRRVIQEKVENKLAELMLEGKLKRKGSITIAGEGKIVVD